MLWHHNAKGVIKQMCGYIDNDRLNGCIEQTPTDRCTHDEELVCGRWGCQDHYVKLRKMEMAGLNKEARAKALQESLMINKNAWEELPGGGTNWNSETDVDWRIVKENSCYRVDWMKDLDWPSMVDRTSSNKCGEPCPKDKTVDEGHVCESWPWQDRRREICGQQHDMIAKMIGGFAAGRHQYFTYTELRLEFDHVFPVPDYPIEDPNPSLMDRMKAKFKTSTK